MVDATFLFPPPILTPFSSIEKPLDLPPSVYTHALLSNSFAASLNAQETGTFQTSLSTFGYHDATRYQRGYCAASSVGVGLLAGTPGCSAGGSMTTSEQGHFSCPFIS